MTLKTFSRIAGAAVIAATLASAAPVFAIGGTNTTVSAPASPSMAQALAEIKAKNWTKAIADLKQIIAAEPSNAEAYNQLGFAYRNIGKYDLSGRAYAKVLQLDPNHTGALEYQGELFIKLGQVDKAKANLAKIKTICGTTCEAYVDLSKALG
jgi:tetratricopeptide (TPR) repeat protein